MTIDKFHRDILTAIKHHGSFVDPISNFQLDYHDVLQRLRWLLAAGLIVRTQSGVVVTALGEESLAMGVVPPHVPRVEDDELIRAQVDPLPNVVRLPKDV